MRRLSSALLCLTLAFPILASAQTSGSGSTSTASGSLFITESSELKTERATRTKDFRVKLLQSSKAEEQYRSQQALFFVKRAENRRTCRENLRKANRDKKFPTTLACFRAELALEKPYRERESAWIAAQPGVPSSVRSIATSRIDLLNQAIDTVILGVDGKVYATNEDLLEARKNLLQKYRLPYAEALVSVRLQALLTWTQHMIVSMDSGSYTPSEAWADTRACFTKVESSLHATLSAETAPTALDVSATHRVLIDCTKSLSPLLTSAQASSASSGR